MLFGLLLLAALPGPGPGAQETENAAPGLPSWAVPVLRLVSATHVVPTTGLVVSDDGLVVVPIEFVAGGDELVVLDGGPDPVRHGRPAVPVSRWPLQGLAILEVERLRRQPVTLAASNPADGEVVRLLAFPPAELIEAGQSSVTELAALERRGTGLRPAAPGLPNLTGALVNACGQLVGFSAARGVQGMGRNGNTLYRWRDMLARDLAAAGVTLASADCDQALEIPRPVPASAPIGVDREPVRNQEEIINNNNKDDKNEVDTGTPEPASEPLVEAPAEPPTEPISESRRAPEVDQPATEPGPGPAGPPEPGSAAEGAPDPPPDVPAPAQTEPSPEPSATRSPVMTPVLLALALALMAALIVALALRWRQRTRAPGTTTAPGTAAPAFRLRPVRGEGAEAAGADIPLFPVAGRIDVLVGRLGTDLLLEHPTVSRRHARLTGAADALQVTDLGSSNGTRVNGLRCGANSPVPLAAGDRLALGALEFELRPGVEKSS